MTFDERLEEAAEKYAIEYTPHVSKFDDGMRNVFQEGFKAGAHWGAQAQREMDEERTKGLVEAVESCLVGVHPNSYWDYTGLRYALQKWREAGK